MKGSKYCDPPLDSSFVVALLTFRPTKYEQAFSDALNFRYKTVVPLDLVIQGTKHVGFLSLSTCKSLSGSLRTASIETDFIADKLFFLLSYNSLIPIVQFVDAPNPSNNPRLIFTPLFYCPNNSSPSHNCKSTILKP